MGTLDVLAMFVDVSRSMDSRSRIPIMGDTQVISEKRQSKNGDRAGLLGGICRPVRDDRRHRLLDGGRGRQAGRRTRRHATRARDEDREASRPSSRRRSNELRFAEVAPHRPGERGPSHLAHKLRDDRTVVLLTEEVACALRAAERNGDDGSNGVCRGREPRAQARGPRAAARDSRRVQRRPRLEQRLQRRHSRHHGCCAAGQRPRGRDRNGEDCPRNVERRPRAAGRRARAVDRGARRDEWRASKTETARSAPLDEALEKRLDDVVEAVTSAAERLDAQQVEIATIASNSAAPSDALELRIEELGQSIASSELAVRVVERSLRLEDGSRARRRSATIALEQRLNDVVHAMTSAAERLDDPAGRDRVDHLRPRRPERRPRAVGTSRSVRAQMVPRARLECRRAAEWHVGDARACRRAKTAQRRSTPGGSESRADGERVSKASRLGRLEAAAFTAGVARPTASVGANHDVRASRIQRASPSERSRRATSPRFINALSPLPCTAVQLFFERRRTD